MNGHDVKSASVESNANNYSKQPQKASRQEHQVRETRQRKDIQRSPQVVNQPLNNENHSINRKEQKSVQTAYDTDVQKRQIQNATQNQQVDNLEIVINLLRVILVKRPFKRAKGYQ